MTKISEGSEILDFLHHLPRENISGFLVMTMKWTRLQFPEFLKIFVLGMISQCVITQYGINNYLS